MFRSGRAVRRSLLMLLACVAGTCAQETALIPTTKLIMVCPKIPVDSLGETVYEYKGEEDKDQATVPGVMTGPVPIKTVEAKYSKAMKRKHWTGEVVLYGVISSTGSVIDLEGQNANQDAVASAIAATKQSRFAPATLDGKPVAIRLKVVVTFKLF